MDTESAADQWAADQTTFQRVYETVLGTSEFVSADTIAERARCSETAARETLSQLVEMGVAAQREGRPATYARNESYLRWKRVESLAADHDAETLRARLSELVEEDEAFQVQFDAPEPAAVSLVDAPISEQDSVDQQWEDLSEWETVRRDIRILRRAVERTRVESGDGATA